MPMHDWSRISSGVYHNLHYLWIATISNQLNAGLLPTGLFAMAEPRIGGPEPDIVTLSVEPPSPTPITSNVATLPQTAFIERAETTRYARRTHRIAIHHGLGTVVAVIEIVSPGNKDTRPSLRSLTRKSAALIRNGIHLLIVDPFPPSRYDRQGIHRAIREQITDPTFENPVGRPLTQVSYQAGLVPTAYVEPFAVGETLADMPLFIADDAFVRVPLEASYMATSNNLPMPIQEAVARSAASS